MIDLEKCVIIPGAPKTMKTKGFHLQKTWFLGTQNKVFDGFGCPRYKARNHHQIQSCFQYIFVVTIIIYNTICSIPGKTRPPCFVNLLFEAPVLCKSTMKNMFFVDQCVQAKGEI